MIPQAQENYMNTKIQTSSPGELTLLLYNGGIRFLKLAIGCLERRDQSGKHTNFMKAQSIIEELQSTLNMEYELSRQLNALYFYINEKIVEANVRQDISTATDCVQMLTELRDTWGEALKSLKNEEKVQPS
ncbi:flagellar export chaperone FliS [Cohnella mopanensis]|uniref:flagellar export chaperone FliS n=1 Tax=Cohnella mopanensis TaxID=2911966 RepID=UPI001EF7C0BE